MIENQYEVVAGVVLGIILLSFFGYMYDQVEKENPKKRSDNNHVILFLAVFYTHPFIFIKRAIIRKSIKDIVIFIAFIATIFVFRIVK